MDCSCTELIYRLEVFCEHVRMLVVFGRDVLLDRVRQRHIHRPSEREEEYVARHGEMVYVS